MEIGGFYELYAVDYNDKKSGADIYNIASILGIQVSRKNKNIIENSNSNPLMAGFPSYTLHKFIDILVKHNKTVVLVEQTTPPPNPQRAVTRIISPATYDENIHLNNDTNFILHLYLQPFKVSNSQTSYAIGICAIDCSTGKTFVDEINKLNNMTSILQEIQKININLNPKEVIISSQDQISDFDEESIVKSFSKSKIYRKTRCIQSDYLNISFQKSILQNQFINNSQLNIFEFLNTERFIVGNISLCYLIQFVQKHNPMSSLKLKSPSKMIGSETLQIACNAPDQLNITSGNINLIDLLNNTKTAVGKRYFRSRMLNPSTDVKFIQSSYKTIERFNSISNLNLICSEMKCIKDIEKIYHKQSNKLQPFDILDIHKSLLSINNIIEILKINHFPNMINIENSCKHVLDYLYSIFNFEIDNGFSSLSTEMFVHKDTEIIKLQNIKNDGVKAFETFVSKLNKNTPTNEYFKLDNNDRDGYFISTTIKRLESFKTISNNISLLKNCNTSHNKNQSKIFMKDEKHINSMIFKSQIEIEKLLQASFQSAVKHLHDIFEKDFATIITFIEESDFYSTCVSNNNTFHLCQPKILQTDDNSSHLQATKLRHPIIEHINKDIKYVSNDITLNANGIILYGINASGKSSLMKSVGIAIVMAQAGMYCAATTFIFNPFQKLYTRITGNDDLYKSQSTFVLEMSELRSIIQNADNKTLVVGDELCSGTETISAVSIVSATIDVLSKRNTAFIFATHLQELDKYTTQENVHKFHLSVSYNEIDDSIIYDRILKPGIGDNLLYGLEVCRSLNMDNDFMELAFQIRNKMVDKKFLQKSKYNSSVYLQVCGICSANASDVHHIKEQKLANENGHIDNFHMNEEFNLIGLCKQCHHSVHHSNLKIYGYHMTTNGRKINFEWEKNEQFNYNDQQVVSDTISIRKHNTIQQTILLLNTKYAGSQFTPYRIKKIMNFDILLQ
jgi:DNA mismatch repair protein MutS